MWVRASGRANTFVWWGRKKGAERSVTHQLRSGPLPQEVGDVRRRVGVQLVVRGGRGHDNGADNPLGVASGTFQVIDHVRLREAHFCHTGHVVCKLRETNHWVADGCKIEVGLRWRRFFIVNPLECIET